MQLSVPAGGPDIWEMVTRENGEGHTVVCGLFGTFEKSTCRTKGYGREGLTPQADKPLKSRNFPAHEGLNPASGSLIGTIQVQNNAH
jgi:hypothetical protein